MTCEKIRIGNHAVILCGRRRPLTPKDREQIEKELAMAEGGKKMSEEQAKFVAVTRASAARAKEKAHEADTLRLPILAREWDYVRTCLEGAADNQERAFRDETLATEERRGIQQDAGVPTAAADTQRKLGLES